MKVLLVSLLLSLGCGREIVREYVPVPAGGGSGGNGSNGGSGGSGSGGSGGSGGKPSYQETQALLISNCQSCHASAAFMQSERGLRSSAAKNRIRNNTMPPNPSALPDKERQKILAFF